MKRRRFARLPARPWRETYAGTYRSMPSAAVDAARDLSAFSAVGRLGIAWNTAERSALTGGGFTTIPPIPAASKHRFGLLWGVGGSYDFTPALSLRLEYEDYGKFGEAAGNTGFIQTTGRATIHMYSLNFLARF